MVYGLNQHTDRQVLIITYDEKRAKKIYEDIKNFNENKVEIFPTREMLFYKVDAISSERLNQRLKVLSRLTQGEEIILVASIESLLDKLMVIDLFKKHCIHIDMNSTLDLEEFTRKLISSGYARETMIEGVGQFSIRGGIIDIFPPNNDHPYRIELFDDEIDLIRTFELETQRFWRILEKFLYPQLRKFLY